MADTKISAMTPAAALTGAELVPIVQGGANVVATAAALAATPTNFTEAANSSTPNATVPVVSQTATNAAASVDIALVPKGAGAFAGSIADNTSVGGNKRGARATDWQRNRSNAAQVASGANSTVGGGTGNTSSGASSFSVGELNTASGTSSTALGESNTASNTRTTVGGGASNTASGLSSTVPGGFQNTADGDYSIAMGRSSRARGTYGASAFSGGALGSGNDQRREFIFYAGTTNATPAVMTTDAGAATATNTLVLPNTALFSFKGQLCVRENATGDSKAIDFTGCIKRGANAAATALLGSVTQADIGTPDTGAATWTVAFSANTTLGGLAITVTGEAAHTLRWVMQIVSTEVVG